MYQFFRSLFRDLRFLFFFFYYLFLAEIFLELYKQINKQTKKEIKSFSVLWSTKKIMFYRCTFDKNVTKCLYHLFCVSINDSKALLTANVEKMQHVWRNHSVIKASKRAMFRSLERDSRLRRLVHQHPSEDQMLILAWQSRWWISVHLGFYSSRSFMAGAPGGHCQLVSNCVERSPR